MALRRIKEYIGGRRGDERRKRTFSGRDERKVGKKEAEDKKNEKWFSL